MSRTLVSSHSLSPVRFLAFASVVKSTRTVATGCLDLIILFSGLVPPQNANYPVRSLRNECIDVRPRVKEVD